MYDCKNAHSCLSEYTREKVRRFLGQINAFGSGVTAVGVLLAGFIAQNIGFEMLFQTVASLFIVSMILLILHVLGEIVQGIWWCQDKTM